MTDADESATAIRPGAGTSEAANGNGDQGSTASAADPLSGLDADTRKWAETKGLKGLADIAKSARNAESLIGSSVRLPGPDAKPEDWATFFRKAGAPETADGYDFTRPDGLPEELFESDAKAFKAELHKLGAPKVLAKQIADYVYGNTAKALKASEDANAEAARTATKALEAEYGGPVGSDQFKAAVRLAERAMTDLGGKDLLDAFASAGLMSPEGHVLNAAVGKMLYQVGRQLYREDPAVRGDPAQSGDNPFTGDHKAKGFNWTNVHAAIRKDRAGALALIRTAGKKPADFGLPDAA